MESETHDPTVNRQFGPFGCIIAALAILGCPVFGAWIGWSTFQMPGGEGAEIGDLLERMAWDGLFGFLAGLVIAGLVIFKAKIIKLLQNCIIDGPMRRT